MSEPVDAATAEKHGDDHPASVEEDAETIDDHLADVEEGAGCTEIWEHLSEQREE